MKNFFLTLKQAIKAFVRRPWRSFLTILGIIIGVASVITIVAVGAGAESLFTSSIEKVGTRTVSVLAGASDDNGPPAAAQGIVIKTLIARDFEKIEALPNIEYASPYVQSAEVLSLGSFQSSTTFEGVGEDYDKVQSFELLQGRFFRASEVKARAKVMVLGAEVWKKIEEKAPLKVGDKIKYGKEKYIIIGRLKSKGAQLFGSPDDRVYIPYTTAQKRIMNIDYIQAIRVMVDKKENIDRVKDKMSDTLRYWHDIDDPKDDDFSIRSIAQALDLITGITGAVQAFLTIVAGISLIVGGIGIMNIMLMNVTQRTREIGLRKSLGATPGMIQTQFLTEAIFLTVLGGVLGILIGIGFAYGVAYAAVSQGYEWKFVIDSMSIMLGVGVSGFIGLVFGYFPARKAARLDPIEALRYE